MRVVAGPVILVLVGPNLRDRRDTGIRPEQHGFIPDIDRPNYFRI